MKIAVLSRRVMWGDFYIMALIKHSEMLKQMASGEPFDITYCKKNGELTDFVQAKKAKSENGEQPALPEAGHMQVISLKRGGHNSRAARLSSPYMSLIPIETASGEIREIYTRAIVKFNQQEVVL